MGRSCLRFGPDASAADRIGGGRLALAAFGGAVVGGPSGPMLLSQIAAIRKKSIRA
ncbi:DUF6053 domain-containing protein [Lysobacter enzymogenes]|uniref:DUF6053 domain-containing protein n=1 Tax=Lysobacter enzymogenes TaxID=69 RepID=UPI003394E647